MDKIKIHGGKTFDLGKQGQFTAFEVEVLSPHTARFYGESENLHVTFEDNIEGKPLHRLLNSNWDHLDLRTNRKTNFIIIKRANQERPPVGPGSSKRLLWESHFKYMGVV